jgi:hypothetical protein
VRPWFETRGVARALTMRVEESKSPDEATGTEKFPALVPNKII